MNDETFEQLLIGQFFVGSISGDAEERYVNLRQLALVLAQNLKMENLALIISSANFWDEMEEDEQDH